jgi:hypothetical protein
MKAQENPRHLSFCGHAILGDRPLVLADATADPRFVDNPLVNGPDGIRAYAGVPLTSEEGFKVGAFCVADHRVRQFSAEDVQILEDLAAQVERELRLVDAIRLQREFIETQRTLVESQQELSRELERAAAYVRSRLPRSLRGEVASDWRFIPSRVLGGDIFDHYWVDADHLVAYIVDVSGHGLGPACCRPQSWTFCALTPFRTPTSAIRGPCSPPSTPCSRWPTRETGTSRSGTVSTTGAIAASRSRLAAIRLP